MKIQRKHIGKSFEFFAPRHKEWFRGTVVSCKGHNAEIKLYGPDPRGGPRLMEYLGLFDRSEVYILKPFKPNRIHTCWYCRKSWTAEVRVAEVGEFVNVSGEKTEFCPTCGKPSCMATEWLCDDGSPWHSSRPI